MIAPILSLDQLAADPTQAADLPPKVARDLLVRVVGLQTVLIAQALNAPAGRNESHSTALKQDRPAQTAAPADLPDPDSRAGLKPGTAAYPRVARSSLLSVKEAAKMLSCSEAAVRKWAYRRQLPTVKVGRLTRFRLTDVEALIARGTRSVRGDKP